MDYRPYYYCPLDGAIIPLQSGSKKASVVQAPAVDDSFDCISDKIKNASKATENSGSLYRQQMQNIIYMTKKNQKANIKNIYIYIYLLFFCMTERCYRKTSDGE